MKPRQWPAWLAFGGPPENKPAKNDVRARSATPGRIGVVVLVLVCILATPGASAQTVAEPAITPASGTLVPVTVNISCATPDAVIRYTLDGSVPTPASPVFYTSLGFTNLTLLRARAFKDGMNPSGTAFAYYVEPVISTNIGYYRGVTNVAGNPLPMVSVTITNQDTLNCYTIEEHLPAALTPVNIAGGGQWLPALGAIRWGPFTNLPTVTVSYLVSGIPGSYTISGEGWADGRWQLAPPDLTVTIQSVLDLSVPSAPWQVATPVIAPLALPAEAATLGGGVTIETTNTGFNGTGFASFPLDGGFIQFDGVNGGEGGGATLAIRYALGDTASRSGRLIVNGVTNNLTFNSTAAWTNWNVLTQRIRLVGGHGNALRIESAGAGLPSVDEITVSPDRPAVEAAVVISCGTPGATIYYTLDGTLPTENSTPYNGPLDLTAAGVVRARAFWPGWVPSVASMANYASAPTIGPASLSRAAVTDLPWAPVMQIAFVPGTGAVCQAYEEIVPPELTITNVSGDGVWSNGVIRWGPYLSTNGQAFSYQAMGPAGSYAVRGRWSHDGVSADLGSTNLTIGSNESVLVIPVPPPQLPAPGLTPAFSATLPTTVVIADAVAGAEIHYTTNGTVPDANSPLYAGSLDFSSFTTLRARAVLAGWEPSVAVVGYYGALANDAGTSVDVVRTIPINTNLAPQIALTATPHGNVSAYTVTETVPLGLTPSNMTQNPVWNPTDRTLKWGPFNNQAMMLSYQVTGDAGEFVCDGQASVDGYPALVTGQSNLVLTGNVDLSVPGQLSKLPTPRLSPASGTTLPVAVQATCAIAGAQLRYTLDGRVPTVDSAPYAGSLEFLTNTTLRVRAFLSGWTPSDAVVGYYQPPASSTGLTLTRSITNNPGYAPQVELTAIPVGNVSAYTVTETVPYGITPFNITPTGIWSAVGRTLKWGPYTNEAHMLAYQVSGLSGTNTLDGAGSVDGFPVAVTGSNLVVVDLGLMPDPAPPAITLQPLSQPTVIGSDLALYVEAVGNPAPGYLWRKDGTAIPGADSPLFLQRNFQSTDAGAYDVVVSNSLGAVTSQVALVTILAGPPTITSQPQSLAVPTGSPAILSVTAIGVPLPAYQWRLDSTNIANAVDSTYTVAAARLADAGVYSVLVSNAGGTVVSSNAVLTLAVPPVVFNYQPGASLMINATDILDGIANANGAALRMTSVSSSSTNGGFVSLSGVWVFYIPANDTPAGDQFAYTAGNGFASVTGEVDLVPSAPGGGSGDGGAPGANQLTATLYPDGLVHLEFMGIPGRTYDIQFTADLNPPSWQTLGTQAADVNGLIRFDDNLPAGEGTGFYRTRESNP